MEEAAEELAGGPYPAYPSHETIWRQFPQLEGVLMHPRIRGYVQNEWSPPDWGPANVRNLIQTGAAQSTNWQDTKGALIMVKAAGQNVGRLGIILARGATRYQVAFLDGEGFGQRCQHDHAVVVDPTGRD